MHWAERGNQHLWRPLRQSVSDLICPLLEAPPLSQTLGLFSFRTALAGGVFTSFQSSYTSDFFSEGHSLAATFPEVLTFSVSEVILAFSALEVLEYFVFMDSIRTYSVVTVWWELVVQL